MKTIAIVTFSLLIALACAAQETNPAEWERPSENIALGKPYTKEPAPDYDHCTDPGDKTQLTDGVYSEGYFWVEESTVGWKKEPFVVITVDLGEDMPIRGASFRTAAGAASVTWPLSIYMLVGDEDKTFYEAGELVSMSSAHGLPDPNTYSTHRYWTDNLQTHGRYMAFVFAAQPYGFVDEIEIYKGDEDWTHRARAGAPIENIKDTMVRASLQEAIRRRILMDITGIEEKLNAAEIDTQTKRTIASELTNAKEACADIPEISMEAFKAILPLNELHRRVLALQGTLWNAQGYQPFTLWKPPLWDQAYILDDPPKEPSPKIAVHLMRNEYRAGCFSISNATSAHETVQVSIERLPGGPNPGYITVHEVQWTGTKSGIPVAAALPEAPKEKGGYVIEVPAGMTRQVWLTFHPEDVEAGIHNGEIVVASANHGKQGLPVEMRVFPLDFPENPTLHFGGWDYSNGSGHRGVTPQNMDRVIAHCVEHFVDSPWATSGVMPRGQHDETGAMTTEPDTAAFEEWITRWPNAENYLVFSSVGSRYGNFTQGTPEFNKAVGEWALFWAKYMKNKGKQAEQLALLLVDEPHRAEQDETILLWAKAINAMNTGIRIWEDPIYRGDMAQANQEMVRACHVLCPNRPIFLNSPESYRQYFVDRRNEGIALEFYSCSGPVRLLDPYAYHRMQAWECWKYKADATYFWALGDTGGGSSWNEYVAPGTDYCPFFLAPASVTAGKHMESIRESVEDFEYLVMLREAIARAEQADKPAETIGKARALLEELPNQVLEASRADTFRWKEPLDRGFADRARMQIADMLVQLQ
ncbi:MAG: hypothetical protein R6V12_04145 [Candidatus Hydrogenedentota bacterium]